MSLILTTNMIEYRILEYLFYNHNLPGLYYQASMMYDIQYVISILEEILIIIKFKVIFVKYEHLWEV